MATIAENLDRIVGAKEAIKGAIINKGVQVPSDAKIDEYSTYIGQIQGGGGGIDANIFNLIISGENPTYIDTLDLSALNFESIGDNKFSNLQDVVKIILPNTCKRLSTRALANNYYLTEIVMDGVEYMGYGVFENTPISTFVLPDGLETCDTSTFANSNAEYIVFPAGFLNGTYCLNEAHKLNKIKFLGLKAPQFDDFDWAWSNIGDEVSGEHTIIVPVDGVGYDTEDFPPYKYLVNQKGWSLIME